MDVHAITRAPVPARRPLRGLRLLGLVGLLLFAVAAFTPLANRLNVADPIDMPRARAVMERAGFTVLPAPTAATGPSDPQSRLGLLRDIVSELAGWMYYRLAGVL